MSLVFTATAFLRAFLRCRAAILSIVIDPTRLAALVEEIGKKPSYAFGDRRLPQPIAPEDAAARSSVTAASPRSRPSAAACARTRSASSCACRTIRSAARRASKIFSLFQRVGFIQNNNVTGGAGLYTVNEIE